MILIEAGLITVELPHDVLKGYPGIHDIFQDHHMLIFDILVEPDKLFDAAREVIFPGRTRV